MDSYSMVKTTHADGRGGHAHAPASGLRPAQIRETVRPRIWNCIMQCYTVSEFFGRSQSDTMDPGGYFILNNRASPWRFP
jgi:hypothetical protein